MYDGGRGDKSGLSLNLVKWIDGYRAVVVLVDGEGWWWGGRC